MGERKLFLFAMHTTIHRCYRRQCLRLHLALLDLEIPYHQVKSHVQVVGINFQDYP